jgi:hypothetical protein
MRVRRGMLVAAALLSAAWPAVAEAIPYFARQYDVPCSQCHISPPKLNAYGEAFVARGYTMPGLTARRTVPLAVWLSGRSELRHGGGPTADDVLSYVNRLELISGGQLVKPWLTYFVEWRPVSFESRGDRTLRDRSGRFEDLFLVATRDRLAVTVGQFRQVQQVDVSRRIGLSEPLVLSAGLPGFGGGSARQQSLRGFSPSGRSPSIRAEWGAPAGLWTWTSAIAVPLPGELSLPLTREARVEASNEIEYRPKGVFLETYVRHRLTSFGAHAFYDHTERYLANALVTGSRGIAQWTVMAGGAEAGAGLRGRWSLEAEVFPRSWLGAGSRVESRAGDGAAAAVLPYINMHFPGTSYTFRLTLEQRIQRGRNATLLELGTIF